VIEISKSYMEFCIPCLCHLNVTVKKLLRRGIALHEIDPLTATLDDRKNAVDVVVAGWLNAVKPATLFASIDGNPVANLSQYLEVTGLFSMGPSQVGSVVASSGVPVGAELFASKAAGSWLMIEGLSPGPHTLHFGGSSDAFTPGANCCTTSEISAFSTDTTAHIVPEPAAWLVIVPGLVVVFGISFARRRYSYFFRAS